MKKGALNDFVKKGICFASLNVTLLFFFHLLFHSIDFYEDDLLYSSWSHEFINNLFCILLVAFYLVSIYT